MDAQELADLLAEVRDGTLPADDALTRLRRLPYAEVAGARIDHHRALRTGHPEAVYGPGKSPDQCARIVAEMLSGGSGPVLLTRAQPQQVTAALAACLGGAVHRPADRGSGRFGDGAQSAESLATVVWRSADARSERVVVASAGTSDGPVACEAAAVLSAFGVSAHGVADIGLAGLHRFLAEVDTLAEADAVIVVAGMEGALATAVAGVTAAPVIAVPTSVGYGAALEGVTALLAMHASCAAGISVVGIDNGFGAAMATMRVLDLAARCRREDV
ncbi:nickel pincer cofactor biosynthesis protein LarB [Candidatus Poriferisodalis sp.]|uniref:nickel pincer cofactor biosynthesis protein LarB n=1 Tax=Candidatus Poriferisodalis sp. TaxID=3101277 RepID=UPI003B01A786